MRGDYRGPTVGASKVEQDHQAKHRRAVGSDLSRDELRKLARTAIDEAADHTDAYTHAVRPRRRRSSSACSSSTCQAGFH